jgi:3-hydroxyacyl-CoA dehydrogenase
MQRKKPGVDVIKDVLDAALQAFPASVFIQSLAKQYEERGFLSKKQLEGLYQKAGKAKDISATKLATLEAIILKMPTRYKSALPEYTPLYIKDEAVGQKINTILAKYPQHKRVLFFKNKYDNNETLNTAEIAELEKFSKMLS